MNPSLRHRPGEHIPRFLGIVHLVALVAGCENTAVVGFRDVDGSTDGGVDWGRDASGDFGAPSDGSTAGDGGAVTLCPRPWALMLAHGASGTYVARFSFATAAPERCDDLRAGGSLSASAIDVEALDEAVVVVVGPDALTAIDVATDTVRWTTPGVTDAIDAQAFALRSDPPWLGVAWWLESSRVGRITGTSNVGDTMEWTWPEQIVGASAHPDPRYVYASGWDNGLFVIAPFSGMVIEELDVLRMWKPHVVVGEDPPRMAGGEGGMRMGELADPPLLFARIIDGCAIRESAPRPGAIDEAIVRCGDAPSSVVLADVIADESRVLLEPNAADPTLHVSGIGVLE